MINSAGLHAMMHQLNTAMAAIDNWARKNQLLSDYLKGAAEFTPPRNSRRFCEWHSTALGIRRISSATYYSRHDQYRKLRTDTDRLISAIEERLRSLASAPPMKRKDINATLQMSSENQLLINQIADLIKINDRLSSENAVLRSDTAALNGEISELKRFIAGNDKLRFLHDPSSKKKG
ncbi:MAG TPA: hypothetical protein VFF81_11450 [Noviherbaspirillum sp.]|nr:hypothetical protein [Noviherbaspirillum sp.]